MDKLARDKDHLNSFWLEIFNELSRRCINVEPFDIDGSKWREIDIHLDFMKAMELVGLGVDSEEE